MHRLQRYGTILPAVQPLVPPLSLGSICSSGSTADGSGGRDLEKCMTTSHRPCDCLFVISSRRLAGRLIQLSGSGDTGEWSESGRKVIRAHCEFTLRLNVSRALCLNLVYCSIRHNAPFRLLLVTPTNLSAGSAYFILLSCHRTTTNHFTCSFASRDAVPEPLSLIGCS